MSVQLQLPHQNVDYLIYPVDYCAWIYDLHYEMCRYFLDVLFKQVKIIIRLDVRLANVF